MGPHIKSITKYNPPEAGAANGGSEGGQAGVPSEETIHHVLAYLSSITRPSKTADLPTDTSQQESGGYRSGAPSRQPTVKFSPNPFLIPANDRKLLWRYSVSA